MKKIIIHGCQLDVFLGEAMMKSRIKTIQANYDAQTPSYQSDITTEDKIRRIQQTNEEFQKKFLEELGRRMVEDYMDDLYSFSPCTVFDNCVEDWWRALQ